MDKIEHTCSPFLFDQSKNKNCLVCRAQDNIVCTCPDWWFPLPKQEELRKLPHGFGGMLAHHEDCAKTTIVVIPSII